MDISEKGEKGATFSTVPAPIGQDERKEATLGATSRVLNKAQEEGGGEVRDVFPAFCQEEELFVLLGKSTTADVAHA